MDNLKNNSYYKKFIKMKDAIEQATEVYEHLGGGIFEHVKSKTVDVKSKCFRFIGHQEIVGKLQDAKREDKILVLKEEQKDVLLINFNIVEV